MPGPSVVELISQINFAVESIEVRFRVGEVKVGDIEDLKGTIDDARLRLWALLKTPTGEATADFEDRFRMRRARELCGRLAIDVEAGRLSARSPELAKLITGTQSLARAVEGAKSA